MSKQGDLFDKPTCPFCGASFSGGHSCQDSEENEYIHMEADRIGCPKEARRRFEEGVKWGWGDEYKKGEIVSRD